MFVLHVYLMILRRKVAVFVLIFIYTSGCIYNNLFVIKWRIKLKNASLVLSLLYWEQLKKLCDTQKKINSEKVFSRGSDRIVLKGLKKLKILENEPNSCLNSTKKRKYSLI